jgi:hypothetical protein
MLKKKIWVNFQRIIELFTQLSPSSQKYGVGIRDPEKPTPNPGSRGQKGTGSRIRIRNTAPVQHPVRDDADAGVERGGGGPHPGDLQALREQAARHDHGEDRNQGTGLPIIPGLRIRIRIRIGSGFNRVSGSGSVFGIRIQEGKNDPQK